MIFHKLPAQFSSTDNKYLTNPLQPSEACVIRKIKIYYLINESIFFSSFQFIDMSAQYKISLTCPSL